MTGYLLKACLDFDSAALGWLCTSSSRNLVPGCIAVRPSACGNSLEPGISIFGHTSKLERVVNRHVDCSLVYLGKVDLDVTNLFQHPSSITSNFSLHSESGSLRAVLGQRLSSSYHLVATWRVCVCGAVE